MKNILSICCLAVISSYSFAQDIKVFHFLTKSGKSLAVIRVPVRLQAIKTKKMVIIPLQFY